MLSFFGKVRGIINQFANDRKLKAQLGATLIKYKDHNQRSFMKSIDSKLSITRLPLLNDEIKLKLAEKPKV